MIKAAKKLKFWSRKKKRRKTHHQPYCPHPPPQRPPPPPPCHYRWSCSSSSSTQPSAPPLPPWLDAEYTYETPLAPPVQPAPEFSYHHHDPVPGQQETAFNTNGTTTTTTSTQYLYPIPTTSYQQYTDPDPVYGVPVLQAQTPRAPTKESCFAAASATRVLNCVVDFGIRLFHCFCPCFCIR